MATNGAVATLPVRSIHAWRYSSPASACPGIVARRRGDARPASAANASTSLAAATGGPPVPAGATYSSSGWTATARLAGSVHGVVVQITSEGRGADGAAGSGATSGKRTYTDGVRWSSYSTSAWASAVLQ